MPRWNLGASVSKTFAIVGERVGNPSASLTSPTTFGHITTQANTPRNFP